MTLVLALAALFSGLDPAASQLYVLFTAALSLTLVSVLAGSMARPRVRVTRLVGPTATAGMPTAYQIQVLPLEAGHLEQLSLAERLPSSFRFSDPDRLRLPPVPPDGLTRTLEVIPCQRGVFRLEGPVIESRFPFGLICFGLRFPQPTRVVVFPRTWPVDRLDVPVARRHQPGGIPLASATGESTEFQGTREYRDGDSLRSIHWKSWARRGMPVVVERQQEYFSRLGVIVDTFARSPRDREKLEAALSVAGSLVRMVAESEHVLDVFVTGNQAYRLQTGRHLADLLSILEVLAGVEPGGEVPFAEVQAHVLDALEGLSCLVVVLLRLDEPRRELLRRLQGRGAALKVLVMGGEGTGEWGETILPTDPESLGRAVRVL